MLEAYNIYKLLQDDVCLLFQERDMQQESACLIVIEYNKNFICHMSTFKGDLYRYSDTK